MVGDLPPAKLHIRRAVSGETIDCWNANELKNEPVKFLKRRLANAKQVGAPRYQQKWIDPKTSEELDDDDVIFPSYQSPETVSVQVLIPALQELEEAELEQLKSACMEDHVDKLRFLLRRPFHPDTIIEHGWTALHFAANAASRRCVEMLSLDAWADKEKKDGVGRTALNLALVNGHLKVVQLLLRLGARATKEEAVKALSLAAEIGDLDLVQDLLNQREDLWNPHLKNLLPLAAKNGYPKLVRFFLVPRANEERKEKKKEEGTEGIESENGMLWQARDKLMIDAFHLAAENGHSEIVQLLLEARADTKVVRVDDGSTALHLAAETGRCKVVKLLLAAGAEKDKVRTDGATALHLAAGHDPSKFFESALARAGAIEGGKVRTDEQTVSFMTAEETHKNHYGVVNCLLWARADKDKVQTDGATALHLAAENNHLDAAWRLLWAGADSNIVRAYDETTSLHLAAKGGHSSVVQVLLGFRADIHATADGQTALQFASDRGHLEVVTALLDASADPDKLLSSHGIPALQLATRKGHLHVVDQLLKARAQVDLVDGELRRLTALHWAALKGHVDIAELLLKARARSDGKNALGQTAVHLAAEYGHSEVAQFLRKLRTDEKFARKKRF